MKISIQDLKSNLQIFGSFLIYKFVIEVIYIFYLSPVYSYYGLTTELNLEKLLFSNIFLVIISIIMPKKNKYPSTTLYFLLTLFLLIPALSYYWLNSQNTIYTLFLTLSFFTMALTLKLSRLNILQKTNYTRKILMYCFFVYVVFSFLLFSYQGGFDVRVLDFSTIYDLREESTLPTLVGYILNWSAKVGTPFFFAYFYYKKMWLRMSIVLLIQLMLYLSYGYKAFLFSILLLLLCIIAFKRKNPRLFIVCSLAVVILFSTILKFNFSIDTLFVSIPYRMVFVPAQAQFQYYEFFSEFPKLNFSEGIIGSILDIKSPYSIPATNKISLHFYGQIFNQNTGVFSDAYANSGFGMMIVFSFVLGMILRAIDSTTKFIPSRIVIAGFSYIIYTLVDVSLLTTFFTGGLGFMIVLFILFNSELQSKNRLEINKNDSSNNLLNEEKKWEKIKLKTE